jgi:predicted AAA+ superfamily ATPase
MYFARQLEADLVFGINHFPVTALIGPRQCGKSTLAAEIMKRHSKPTIYLDLERPSDLEKLNDAEWFLSSQKDKLICIDEVQRKPDLFPLIRSLVDEWNRTGCFLILGSASRDLLLQSSESLAGRIVYKQLTPLLWSEVKNVAVEQYFERGGFPRSLLAASNKASFEWRNSFIQTFLERDLLQWANFTPQTMRRLWQMLAHVNGQTVNYTSLGNSLGVSNQTVRNYIDLLQSTYMVDAIQPFSNNLGKRLVKSQKIYVTDAGITASLLGLKTFVDLSGHPAFGALWESIVLINLRGHFPNAEIFHYRTTNGAEVDFVVRFEQQQFVVECKASYAPKLSKGNFIAIEDVNPLNSFIVTPSNENWPMKKGIDVVSLNGLIASIKGFLGT